MEKMTLGIFRYKVERQCKFVIMAYESIQQSIGHETMDLLWYSIQAFLVAAGNISKLFWPTRTDSLPERGEELRADFSIADDSPLQPRIFRNHFEHFDERLEDWAISSERKNFIDSNVGPSGMISGIEPDDYLRNFDTKNSAVTFRGDIYHLEPIANSIQSLLIIAQAKVAEPWWKQ